jgi:MoaA/NifB/PqqE/SkfB family radical SAM enzyme
MHKRARHSHKILFLKDKSMDFPQSISFTITNHCNLRCRMCGQWSEEGYIHNHIKNPGSLLPLSEWKRIVDEIAPHRPSYILLRGGEPFLFPGIIALIEHIHEKGIFISIDTNGTLVEKYAQDLVRIGNMHLTFSVDGPEEIHDSVRSVKGSFQKIKHAIALLNDLEHSSGSKLSKSICFTISPYSYLGLGEMPNVARSMSIPSMNIVPFYYFPAEVGKRYEAELRMHFNCQAFSWKGFHHEDSGIDFRRFRTEYRNYLANLGEIIDFPYMKLTEEEYDTWFNDPTALVGSQLCNNVETLIDIQPDGEANFCVDFPDYSIGNVKEATIADLWNGTKAAQFRAYRRKNPLAICYRCGSKYMSEI